MTELALRAAITDFPDEDTPRLIYADWLDETERPERAEFIRLQIELEQTPTNDPRRTGRGNRASLAFRRLLA